MSVNCAPSDYLVGGAFFLSIMKDAASFQVNLSTIIRRRKSIIT